MDASFCNARRAASLGGSSGRHPTDFLVSWVRTLTATLVWRYLPSHTSPYDPSPMVLTSSISEKEMMSIVADRLAYRFNVSVDLFVTESILPAFIGDPLREVDCSLLLDPMSYGSNDASFLGDRLPPL